MYLFDSLVGRLTVQNSTSYLTCAIFMSEYIAVVITTKL